MRMDFIRFFLLLMASLMLLSSCGKNSDHEEVSGNNNEVISGPEGFRKVGNRVTFGRYEQDCDFSNGLEPIEWIVLDVKDDKCLLLSRYGLDTVLFSMSGMNGVGSTWEKSSLRAWLNDEFMNFAFSEKERSAILLTDVDNGPSQGFDSSDTKYGWKSVSEGTTQDRIFLLSYQEANKYFKVPYNDGKSESKKARCAPTPYAVLNGANGSYDDELTEDGQNPSPWWLRSLGKLDTLACIVNYSGTVEPTVHNTSDVCVRPVLWLDLNSDAVNAEPGEDSGSNSGLIRKIVTFGHYEQDNDLSNGPEPIEWSVLDEKDGKILLLSRYGILMREFSLSGYIWEKSELREWLNSEFIADAFSNEEQSCILLSDVDNSPDQGVNKYYTKTSSYMNEEYQDTQDRVFLLSCAEACRYLTATRRTVNCLYSVMHPTDYAFSNAEEIKPNSSTMEGDSAWWWWLRSPGEKSGYITKVTNYGTFEYSKSSLNKGCVRPALWLNLESEDVSHLLTVISDK